ncbi:MAG TPA: sigma-54 dependent transcriptional regulator [Longimicrobiales bacterium]|nr:sigma-54 dependent transcriptional regulator [Longimicrobiales bacterium]
MIGPAVSERGSAGWSSTLEDTPDLTSERPPLEEEPGSGAPVRIIVIDGDRAAREGCLAVLRQDGYTVAGCGSGEALRMLHTGIYDIAFIDAGGRDLSGVDLLRAGLQMRPGLVAVMTTADASVEASRELLDLGAWDYLPKPFSGIQLSITAARAARTVAATRQAAPYAAEDSPTGGRQSIQLLGTSPSFLEVLDLARRVAPTDAPVFISGESGTGKEMIAQLIHRNSRRRARSLVAVNCAAIQDTLLESEMFGHCKGSFTGALRDKVGLLEAAHRGTMFLDEVTEMSPGMQAKLLRVLQDGNVRRVGSENGDISVDVRFIAATNRDPREAIKSGILRRDLYYRLGVVPIRIPPLRERPEDIPLLAEHFLATFWRRHRDRRAPLPHLGPAALRSLQSRAWSGNARELQNVMEHAVVLLAPGVEIQPTDLPFLDEDVDGNTPWRPASSAFHATDAASGYHDARDQALAQFELHYLTDLIDQAGANMSRAAKIAGVDRTTLYRLMAKHQLHRNIVVRSA